MTNWLLIEKAYGEYEISSHRTKKEAINYIGCSYKSTKINAGAYEIETDDTINIVCTKESATRMGFE